MIEPSYRGRLRRRRKVLGADVECLWVLTSQRKTVLTRLGFYGSYAAAPIPAGIRILRPDMILASSPPLPVGAAGGRSLAPAPLPVSARRA